MARKSSVMAFVLLVCVLAWPALAHAQSAIIGTARDASGGVLPGVTTRATRVERITQLDLKVAKTFRVQRVSISPELEIFNLNDSDAIISYVTTNQLWSSFLRPNSIMQGRMLGVGATVRW